MAESCISVGYIILLFKAGCFSIHSVLFSPVFCILWLIMCFRATGSCFCLVYAWMLNRFFTFYWHFWVFVSRFAAFGLFSALLLKIVSYFFLNLLTCECRSKAVFSWITRYKMNISLFWPISIFGWPHTPKMLLAEWAERRDAALSHLKIKSFIIHALRWFTCCQIVRSYHHILFVYPFSVNCLVIRITKRTHHRTPEDTQTSSSHLDTRWH